MFDAVQSDIRDDIMSLIFTYSEEHPILLQILEILWQNDKLIDQNEGIYIQRFENYLKNSLKVELLRKNVGTLCSCLSILCQKSYQLQAQTLRLLQEYVMKLLKLPLKEH